MATLSRGAGSPVVVAQTQSELLPGLDRRTVVLWLGLGLVAANEVVDRGPLRTVFEAAQGHYDQKTALGLTGDIAGATLNGLPELSLMLGLVGVFWVMARASDSAGNLAVLLLIALWLVWLTTHVQNVAKLFGQPLSAPAALPPVTKPASK